MRHHLPFVFRSALLVTSMVAPVFALGVMSLAQDNPAPKPTAKEKFKNIKVLKDLPADQLIPVMQKINLSLGVRCGFCHVAGAPEKDDKPEKEAAREMAIMTGDINKRHKSVANKVTCFTCHHGHAQPETPETAGKSDKPEKPKE